MVLTPAGRLLVEQGWQLLEAADRLVEQSRQVDSGWESCVNIAIDSVYGVEKLLPLVEELAFGSTAPTLLYRQLELVEVATLEWVFMVASSHPLALCAAT